tara:strand:+ start:347 stop:934 length:588 start_codon:yes stop_codon:yes gene_type:complete
MNTRTKIQAYTDKGFTLLELLVVVAIIVITTTLIPPKVSTLLTDSQSKQKATELKQALVFSRNSAISMARTVVFCPVSTNGTCGRDWNQQLSVFVDENGDKTLNGNEQILKVLSPSLQSEHRAYNNVRISFGPLGRSNVNAGSLSYCKTSSSRDRGTSLIISRMGRVREGKDQNRDGLPELANGLNIPCINRSPS